MEGKEIKEKRKSNIQFLITLGIIIAAVFLLNQFVIINARVPSGSMENTIQEGDRIFGNRLAYLSSDPERFDIVIFKFPDNESELYIKRIIGLPGETVTIKDGKVYINDDTKPLDDSFCAEVPEAIKDGVYEVPDDCYFMLGDNRNNSSDSRFWNNKYVKRDQIIAEAALRYWPLTEISIIN